MIVDYEVIKKLVDEVDDSGIKRTLICMIH